MSSEKVAKTSEKFVAGKGAKSYPSRAWRMRAIRLGRA